MKRVLLFGGELTLRGSTLYTATLARELKLRGHKVALLGPGGLFSEILESHRIPLLREPVHASTLRNLLYVAAYCACVREFEPDVLHVQHQDLAWIGGLISRRTRVPCVLTVHAQVHRPVRFPLGHLPRVIAISEDVRQSLVTAGQIPRELIDVVPNGVSASLSSLQDSPEPEIPRDPVVGTVNRIDDDRGIDLLLRAARRVLDRGARARFLVLGEGPAERSVRKLARDLELTPHLTVALPRSRISHLFRPMDLFVSASQSESHGIFLLSAMAQARPVISSAVGGVLSFLRDGENGLVVERGNVEALSDAILRALADPAWTRELGRTGFREVRERFPLSAMVERTVEAYG